MNDGETCEQTLSFRGVVPMACSWLCSAFLSSCEDNVSSLKVVPTVISVDSYRS